MSQRANQKTASRHAIVQTAANLLRERGASGASVQQVMAGAGRTVGAFYAHFDDKRALVAEALGCALVDAKAMVEGAANGRTGATALADVVERYLGEEHRDEPRLGCPLPAMLGEGAAADGETSPELLAGAVVTMQGWLREIAAGDGDPDDLLALVALLVGGQVLARATRGTALSSQVLTSCRAAGARLAGSRGAP